MTAMMIGAAERRHDSWTRSYRLSHCEGYAVYSPGGRLGYVEDIVPPSELGEPVALKVRFSHPDEGGSTLVPIDLVCEVLPRRERIVVEDLSLEIGDAERSNAVTDTKMKPGAKRGDLLVVHGHAVGKPERTGEILEVVGEPGHEHYRVRWEDEHETFVYPSSDTSIRPAKR
jgi:hypothetical protein